MAIKKPAIKKPAVKKPSSVAAKKPAVKPAAAAAKKPATTPAAKPTAAALPKASSLFALLCAISTVGMPEPGEAHNAFVVRACDGINKLDDVAYGKLPKKVTDWFDSSVDHINKEQVDQVEQLEGYTAPAKPKRTAKQASLPGLASGGKARTDSVAYRVRCAVVEHGPDTVFEDACKKAGVGAQERGSNAWNAYFNAIQVLRIVESFGGIGGKKLK